jgi:hypothetical protein
VRPFARVDLQGGSLPIEPPPLRALWLGVDGLTVTFKVRLYDAVRLSVEERLALVDGKHGWVEWENAIR